MKRHAFPDDLVRTQKAWTRTYAELARPRAPGSAGTTVLRRRLIRLSTAIYFHPYWARPRPDSGRADLLRLVRSDRPVAHVIAEVGASRATAHKRIRRW